LDDLALIAKRDSTAICASRIFSGLEQSGTVRLNDYVDLVLMHQFGYRQFMLSDGICQDHFHQAMKAWQTFIEHYSIAE
jgi:menaquinone-dependent protoporphyrinogen IX oxidase